MSWRDELLRRFPKLDRLGPDAYVVGGAIRDLLAGREPADVDVACLDPLAAAKRIRDRVIRLGDDGHLTAWRVVDGAHTYDFAALLDDAIEPDLARRDFTVNAMAVDLGRDVLLDPHGGQADLDKRLVRMVQASNFDDDPLRTLKGVRMAVRYDMTLEPATLEAIRLRAPRIADVAVERVSYELSVILSSNAFRRGVDLLAQTGLAEPLGLRIGDVHADDVPLAAALAILVADPKQQARRWRWSAGLLRDVQTLQQLAGSHDRMELYDAGPELAQQLEPLLRALGRDSALDLPDFSIRPLLTGEQIAELTTLPPGPELGALKRALLEAQVRGEVRTREEGERFVRARGRGGAGTRER
jgi:tRNA nucleotidyltransferase/poly(A) polymerase